MKKCVIFFIALVATLMVATLADEPAQQMKNEDLALEQNTTPDILESPTPAN